MEFEISQSRKMGENRQQIKYLLNGIRIEETF